jgi:putative glycosyltransferase (TIGR04372 family)
MITIIQKFIKVVLNPRLVFNRLSDMALLIVIGFPLALLVRICRPIVHCRFASIYCAKIGNLWIGAEVYLCEKELGVHKSYRNFLFTEGAIVNQALLTTIKRRIEFYPIAKYIYWANSFFPNEKDFTFSIYGDDYTGVRQRTGKQFENSNSVRKRGEEWLKSLGIEPDQQLLLFSNRDSRHLDRLMPERDWSYHSYRDSSIHNLLPMVEHFIEQGYAAIRMGSDVAEPLQSNNPMIIDYPNVGRTDERDVFLGERCNLSISSSSGIRGLTEMFRRPSGIINACPLTTELMLGDKQLLHAPLLWIPKQYWLIAEKRFMSLREIIDLGANQFFHTQDYTSAGIKLIENSPEEILEFVLEVEQQLNNERSLTDEDLKLYQKFWQIVLPNKNIKGRAKIGISFLKRNSYLLN